MIKFSLIKRDFVVVEGASALEPQKPTDLDGVMHLYTLEIPSFTHNTDDVTITKVDNRRYTMRDIGLLEQRIENVEYYTQLNLLEQTLKQLKYTLMVLIDLKTDLL